MAALSGACCRPSNAAAAARRVLQHVTYTGRASLHSGNVVAPLALRARYKLLLAFPQRAESGNK